MNLDPAKMCFGLTEEIDRQSFQTFLRLCGQQELSQLLATRMTSEEITRVVDSFFDLLKKHLSKNEYHQYFLLDNDHHHQE